MKQKTKHRLEQIEDYLFKDVSILDGFSRFIYCAFAFTILYFIIQSIRLDYFSGAFQYAVVFFIAFRLVHFLDTKITNAQGIQQIGLFGMVFFFFLGILISDPYTVSIGAKVYIWCFLAHILYIVFQFILNLTSYTKVTQVKKVIKGHKATNNRTYTSHSQSMKGGKKINGIRKKKKES